MFDVWDLVVVLLAAMPFLFCGGVWLGRALEREQHAMNGGCDCTELCSMGPTCPGGMLARLPGAGCWRMRNES